jgi:hypothetical protein
MGSPETDVCHKSARRKDQLVYYRSLHRFSEPSRSAEPGALGRLINHYKSSAIRATDGPSTSSLWIAVPPSEAIPSFDTLFNLALGSVLSGLAVLIVCMTEELRTSWEQRVHERAGPVGGLAFLDGRLARSDEWRRFLAGRRYAVIIIHGILAGLQDQSVLLSHAIQLVDVLPTELVILV